MTRINVNVKTLDGQSHSMDSVDDGLTVSQFKVEVGRMLGLDPGTLRMIYSGRVLQDEKPLSEFDLNSKTVHVVQRAPPQTQRPNPTEPSPSSAPPPPERRFPFPTIEVLMPLRGIENPPRSTDESRATGRLQHARFMLNRARRILSNMENRARERAGEEQTPSSNEENGGPEYSPRLSREFASLMREYRGTNSRLVPFMEEIESSLDSPVRRRAQQNQELFDDVTEVMHLMSHVQHALSDSTIDFSEEGQLYVRSRAALAETPEPQPSVSLRVRTPRATLGPVTTGTNRTVNLMISGDWQPRAINSGTQSFTTTNASSSPVTASGVAANPPTSGSDSTSTSSASASNSSPMMSFIDLMTAGVTQGQVGASIGEGASTSLPSAIDLQREILSSFQVALGATARISSASFETNDPNIRLAGSSGAPNLSTAQSSFTTRSSSQSGELPSFFDDLRSVLQSFDHPTSLSSSSNVSPSTSVPVTSSTAQSSSSSPLNIQTSASPRHQNLGSSTTTPILITPEMESNARPGFSDPRLQRFSHRAHRNLERNDPFLICGSWRAPSRPVQEPRAEGQTQTSERLSTTTPATSSSAQTPSSDNLQTPTEPQQVRTEGDQNSFVQRFLPEILQVLQDFRSSSPGLTVPNLQSVLQQELGPNGPQPNNLLLADVLGYASDSGTDDSIFHEAVMAAAQQITTTDFLSVIAGDFSFFSRIQQPVADVLRRRMFLEGTISTEEGVLTAIDELHPYIERIARQANPNPNVDIAESLNKFLHSRLLAISLCLMNCSNDQFAESMMTLLANAMENFVLLLIKSCVDGPQSCERVVQAIIEQMVEDVDFPPPTVGQVIAHLRNYMARVQRERGEERVDHWIVNSDSAEWRNRQRARAIRLESRIAGSNAEDGETFVTPRSSPDPMDMETGAVNINEQVVDSSSAFERTSSDSLIPPSMRANELPFPRELLIPNTTRSEVSGRQGPWHAHLPRDWVAIVDRDTERQANQAAQPPFSDGYLSMQPAKRRRVVAAKKPTGDLSSVIAETIRDAISASGVSPVSSVNAVVNEAAGSTSLARAMEVETRRIASENVSSAPNECDKFPNLSEFAKK